ncbi:MAG: hypothetical protein KGI78_01340 [Patescibacteria group bacterium]|nr:hypothetical protein [Patescibacteria group bacterium]MDE1944381.1 hypothetical protein [Patescibacteria group bacterium]MDE1944998.1 hypothetical protein [Patescibacteria group bacterium]MDE2057478.1 hypothetical protein [Patescibacteria group bacterium]
MKTIAIVGHGYVGRAMEAFFKEKFSIVLYDPPQGFADQQAVNAADLAVVCVPTVMGADGAADLSAIEETFAWLTTPLVIIKSTVPPGTSAALAKKYGLEDRLAFSPEFIGEGGYPVPFWEGVPHPTDMTYHRAFIFGGARAALERILPFFTTVRGPFAEYRMTDTTTAELTKYMENAWIGTKVTFCNEFYDIARAYGVSYDELRELWLTDGRVGRSHTLVYPEKRGFGGKCIPKDTAALYRAAAARGYEPSLLRAVIETNAKLRNEPPPVS